MRRSEARRGPAPYRRAGLLGLWLLAASLSALGKARADESPSPNPPRSAQLTSRGRWLLGGSVGGSWSDDPSASVGVLKHWQVYAWPSLTYFLRDRVGVGLMLGGGARETRYSGPGFRDYDVQVGVLGAFDLPLSAPLSLLFRPNISYVSQWGESTLSVADSTESVFRGTQHVQTLRALLDAHLVVRVSPHVGFSFGPDLWLDFILDDGGLRKAQSRDGRQPKQKYTRLQVGVSAGVLFSL